jgi:hypothetical protein
MVFIRISIKIIKIYKNTKKILKKLNDYLNCVKHLNLNKMQQQPTQISTNKINIYKPAFDLESGQYIDESPILPRQTLEFKCLCNQKTFNTVTKFKQHISLKGHQRYISCYLEHLQDANEVKDEMMRLRMKYELNERKLKNSLKSTEDKLTETQIKLESAEKTIQQFVNPSYRWNLTQTTQPMNLD